MPQCCVHFLPSPVYCGMTSFYQCGKMTGFGLGNKVVLPRLAEFGESTEDSAGKKRGSGKTSVRTRRSSLGSHQESTTSLTAFGFGGVPVVGIKGEGFELPTIDEELDHEPKHLESHSYRLLAGLPTSRGGALFPDIFNTHNQYFRAPRVKQSSQQRVQLGIEGHDIQLPPPREPTTSRKMPVDKHHSGTDLYDGMRHLQQQQLSQGQADEDQYGSNLFDNLQRVLACHSIGIPIEISRLDYVPGRVATPLFHCPRCLEHWDRLGILPEACHEPAQLTRGPAMLITKKTSKLITQIGRLRKFEGVGIRLADFDRENLDDGRPGSPASDGSDAYDTWSSYSSYDSESGDEGVRVGDRPTWARTHRRRRREGEAGPGSGEVQERRRHRRRGRKRGSGKEDGSAGGGRRERSGKERRGRRGHRRERRREKEQQGVEDESEESDEEMYKSGRHRRHQKEWSDAGIGVELTFVRSRSSRRREESSGAESGEEGEEESGRGRGHRRRRQGRKDDGQPSRRRRERDDETESDSDRRQNRSGRRERSGRSRGADLSVSLSGYVSDDTQFTNPKDIQHLPPGQIGPDGCFYSGRYDDDGVFHPAGMVDRTGRFHSVTVGPDGRYYIGGRYSPDGTFHTGEDTRAVGIDAANFLSADEMKEVIAAQRYARAREPVNGEVTKGSPGFPWPGEEGSPYDRYQHSKYRQPDEEDFPGGNGQIDQMAMLKKIAEMAARGRRPSNETFIWQPDQGPEEMLEFYGSYFDEDNRADMSQTGSSGHLNSRGTQPGQPSYNRHTGQAGGRAHMLADLGIGEDDLDAERILRHEMQDPSALTGWDNTDLQRPHMVDHTSVPRTPITEQSQRSRRLSTTANRKTSTPGPGAIGERRNSAAQGTPPIAASTMDSQGKLKNPAVRNKTGRPDKKAGLLKGPVLGLADAEESTMASRGTPTSERDGSDVTVKDNINTDLRGEKKGTFGNRRPSLAGENNRGMSARQQKVKHADPTVKRPQSRAHNSKEIDAAETESPTSGETQSRLDSGISRQQQRRSSVTYDQVSLTDRHTAPLNRGVGSAGVRRSGSQAHARCDSAAGGGGRQPSVFHFTGGTRPGPSYPVGTGSRPESGLGREEYGGQKSGTGKPDRGTETGNDRVSPTRLEGVVISVDDEQARPVGAVAPTRKRSENLTAEQTDVASIAPSGRTASTTYSLGESVSTRWRQRLGLDVSHSGISALSFTPAFTFSLLPVPSNTGKSLETRAEEVVERRKQLTSKTKSKPKKDQGRGNKKTDRGAVRNFARKLVTKLTTPKPRLLKKLEPLAKVKEETKSKKGSRFGSKVTKAQRQQSVQKEHHLTVGEEIIDDICEGLLDDVNDAFVVDILTEVLAQETKKSLFPEGGVSYTPSELLLMQEGVRGQHGRLPSAGDYRNLSELSVNEEIIRIEFPAGVNSYVRTTK